MLKKRASSHAEADFEEQDLITKELTIAELSERMKNILFCSISHELRSPVHHINGILDIIKSYIVDEKILQFINIAMSSTEMLMSKINDILDYSLLETNTLDLKPIDFNIRNLMANIEDILNLQFDHKMIEFGTYVNERVPNIIILDYKRLKQILINLIYNALKYTEKGFVSVEIDCVFYDQNNVASKMQKDRSKKQCELTFMITDSGCGLETKKRNQFQLFSNANLVKQKIEKDKDVFKSSELMGMGLAFCHKMLNKMESKLELSSLKNLGSRFSFKLRTKYKPDIEEPNSARNISHSKLPGKIAIPLPMGKNNDKVRMSSTQYVSNMGNSTTMKSKRSSSVFNNDKFGNLRVKTNNMLKPIEEANENM
jgi:two-component system, sensor histidine kinase and response regulator